MVSSLILIVALCFSCMNVLAQSRLDSAYTFVEKMPEFPGGEQGLHNYILKNLENIPKDIDATLTKVYVEFIVRKSGKISDVKIVRNASQELDRAVLKIFEICPIGIRAK